MKKIWISISAFGLALGMATVGLVGANISSIAKAEDSYDTSGHTWGLMGSFDSWNSEIDFTFDANTNKSVLSYYTMTEGTEFKIRADNAWTFTIGGDILTQSRTGGDTYFSIGSDNNVAVKTGYTGLYTFYIDNGYYDYEDKTYGVTVSYSQYIVNEYAVVDGTLESSPFLIASADSSSEFYPTNVFRSNYYIVNWFTDSTCTTAYTPVILSSNINLYCQYSSVTSSATTVYFTNSGWTNTYIYSFGGQSQFGDWPGTLITTLTNGATLNGVGAVYKAELHSEYGDDHVIFNDGTGGNAGVTQTNNMVVTDGVCYQLSDANEATGNVDLGAAAKVVYDINYYRCNVAASGSILEDSVCGIGKNDAASAIAEYDALNATAKGYVNNSTDYTYNYQDTAGSAINVSYVDIIAQLRLLAVDGSSGSAILNSAINNNPAIILAILFSTISAVGIATYFIIRKKKALDQR